MDWNDEQSVIDVFVESVHAVNESRADRAGRRLVKNQLDYGWDRWDNVADGTLLAADEIPETPQERVEGVVGVEALEDVVSPERFSELEDEDPEGASFTSEELAVWRRLAAEEILRENPDCDVYELWSIRRVTHSDGREAFTADVGGGYSFTEPWVEYVAGAATESDALAALRKRGFISVEDFRARWKPNSPR